jgi:hypothetical protein
MALRWRWHWPHQQLGNRWGLLLPTTDEQRPEQSAFSAQALALLRAALALRHDRVMGAANDRAAGRLNGHYQEGRETTRVT